MCWFLRLAQTLICCGQGSYDCFKENKYTKNLLSELTPVKPVASRFWAITGVGHLGCQVWKTPLVLSWTV
jgi:hypothetical protein